MITLGTEPQDVVYCGFRDGSIWRNSRALVGQISGLQNHRARDPADVVYNRGVCMMEGCRKQARPPRMAVAMAVVSHITSKVFSRWVRTYIYHQLR